VSSISATVASQPITATVTGSTVSAAVTSSSSSVSIAGGVGPQGPAGTSGGPLEQLSNVQITSAQPGDVLRFSNSKWRNSPETDIVDGGNW
jgi:hypothetical protein